MQPFADDRAEGDQLPDADDASSYGQLEPGLDLHVWETELALLREQLQTDPTEVLPELLELVERVLDERAIEHDEPVTAAGLDPEIRAELVAARDVASRVAVADRPDPSDVAQAASGLLGLLEGALGSRRAF